MKKIIVLGAGLTGLSTAFHLDLLSEDLKSISYEVYEREKKVGGLCSTENVNGFLFDYSGHLLHLKNNYSKGLVENLLGDNIISQKRSAWIYLANIYIKYPFQANFNVLPDNMKKECSAEYRRSYFENKHKSNDEFNSFEEWVFGRFGSGIAKYFMIPYNKKLWKYNLNEMTCRWVGEYIPVPDADDVSDGKSSEKKKDYGYNIDFQYPARGGIQPLSDAFAMKIKGVRLNMQAEKINIKDKVIVFENGEKIHYNLLVSTIPLKELLRRIENLPEKIKNANEKLKHTSVLVVNIGINKKDSLMHWVYVPEERYAFYRFGYFSNFSENMAPEGQSSIYCEVSYKKGLEADKEKIYRECVNGLIDIGAIKDESEIIERKILDIEYAYVIYNKEYENSTKTIHEYLKAHDIYSIGRYGRWEYSSMEESILEGKELVETIKNGMPE